MNNTDWGDEDSDHRLAARIDEETSSVTLSGSRAGLRALAQLLAFYSREAMSDDHTHWWKCPPDQERLLTIVLCESRHPEGRVVLDACVEHHLLLAGGHQGMRRLLSVVDSCRRGLGRKCIGHHFERANGLQGEFDRLSIILVSDSHEVSANEDPRPYPSNTPKLL